MYLTEYDHERALAELREEAIEIGLEQGLEQGLEKGVGIGLEQGVGIGLEKGRLEILAGLVKDGLFTLAQAAARVGMTVPEFKARVAALDETL